MTTVYAPTQIEDALLKMQIYINMLTTKNSPQKLEKVVILATETFIKFMQNQEFAKSIFDKVKNLTLQKQNYYGLLLIDQMLKNSKIVFKAAKRQLQTIFKIVWERVWNQYDNYFKIQNLKLLVKVWGYIYGQKFQENLRKWVELTFKTKMIISSQNQAQIKELYGMQQQPKMDTKMQEIINNMDLQQKPRFNSSNHESLLEALGIDQE